MADRTLYDILEVSPGASSDTIRQAYQLLSSKFDPDREENRANPEAKLRYDAIREAYLTLATPEKRAQYDKKLETRARPEIRNVQVVESFWTLPRLLVLALIVTVGGGYYYKYQQDQARLEAGKAIAAAKAKEAEEMAKAEAEQAQLQLRLDQQQRAAEAQQRRERDMALQRYQIEQRAQAQQDRILTERERREKQMADSRRQQEETRAAIAARQQLAREKAELCRLERERYGRALSC